MPLELIRLETTLGGQPVTLEVRQVPAVQALRLLRRLTEVAAGAVAGLTKGALAWISDADFEALQRTLLAQVAIRRAGSVEVLDFDDFMRVEGVDAELVLELLWTVAQATYPRSFSRARALMSNPASLKKLLETIAPKGLPRAPVAAARTAPESAPAPGTPPTSRPSAY